MNTERTAQTVHERLEPLIRRTPLQLHRCVPRCHVLRLRRAPCPRRERPRSPLSWPPRG